MCTGEKNFQGSQSDLIMNTSSSPIKLRILVVDDDAEFLAFISGLLKLLKHEVVALRNPIQALSTLFLEEGKFDLIMAELYMPDMGGLQILTRFRDELKVPLIMVSADNRESAILEALEHGATHYIVKPVCFSDVKNLWQLVVQSNGRKRSNSNITVEHIGSVRQDYSSSTNGKMNSNRKRPSTGSKTYVSTKKHKVEWTSELQARFLEAVYYIGLNKAVPKIILEVMNVEGLTRENVASHLQKYRMFLRRVAAKISASKLSVDRHHHARRASLHQNIPGHRRTILQQPRSFRNNFELPSVNRNATNLSLLRCYSNDDGASSSRSVPRSGYSRQPYLPIPRVNFDKHMSSTPNPFHPAANSFGFQSMDGTQRIWSNTTISTDLPYRLGSNNANGIEIGTNSMPMYQQNTQESPQPFTSSGIDNANYTSWNGNMGSLNGKTNLVTSYTNNNNFGRELARLMDPNQMVFNAGWDSYGITNIFGDLMRNSGTQNDDQNMINISPIENTLFGYDSFGKEHSSSFGFGGARSSQMSLIFSEGNNIAQQNVSVSAVDPLVQPQQQYGGNTVNSSNNSSHVTVVDSSSSSTEITSYLKGTGDDDFDLRDIFLNELHLEPVNADKGKGKNIMNSDQDCTTDDFDLSDIYLDEFNLEFVNNDKGKGKQVMNSNSNASVVQQNAPFNKESFGQGHGDFMDLEFDADGLSFKDGASLENPSLDEDWDKILASIFM